MRLIDADKLETHEFYDGIGFAEAVYIDDIREMPEPIVRCKDCEFWGESQEGSCGAIDDPYMLHTDANDFCSWGKRRTDKVTEKE